MLLPIGKYVNEFGLWFNEEMICVGFWLADSCRQSWALYDDENTYMQVLYNVKKCKSTNKLIEVSLEPYVKYSHIMGRGITWIQQKEDYFSSNQNTWRDFALKK